MKDNESVRGERFGFSLVLPPLGLGHHPGEGNFHAARSWNKDLASSPTSHLKWGTSTLGELKKSLTRNLVAFGHLDTKDSQNTHLFLKIKAE